MDEFVSPELSRNLARAQKFLEPFISRQVPHFIAGEKAGSASGATFETLDPTTNARQAPSLPARPPTIDRAAGPRRRPSVWRDRSGRQAPRHPACDRRRDRGARRRDRARREFRHRPADPLHGEGGVARRREFPLLRRSRARRAATACSMPDTDHFNYLAAAADRPGRRHHAVEHAVHAVDLEDRAGARGRLHGRAQAGRMEPAVRRHPDGNHGRGNPRATGFPRASSISCTGSARPPARR